MSKVICIDAIGTTKLNEGEIYTAYPGKDLFIHENYFILESENYYCADRFIPLSDEQEDLIIEKERHSCMSC